MAFTQTILTRPTLLVSALVLTVGTVICYNYLSKPPAPKDSDKDNTRSISSVKKDTQKDKASETPESTTQHASATNPEQHDTKTATTHETTPLNDREINNKEPTAAVQHHDAVETEKKAAVTESTKDDTIAPEPVTKEQTSREMKPVETKTTKPEPVEIVSAPISEPVKIESAATEAPAEAKDEEKIEEKAAAEEDAKVETEDKKEEDVAQVESSTATTSDEDAKVEEKTAEKEDTKVEEKAENITQQQQPSEEGAAPSSPLDSSSTTSSSSGSAKQMDESYPASTLTTPSASKSSSTYWQQPNNDPMSQYGFAWPTLIPVPEFRPQQQQNQQSFYSNEAGNPIPGQDENRPRGKKGRRVKKRLSRVERIEEQRQTHKPTMKSRCDYWPYCSNRNCKFIHPVKPCRVGDGCGFGNRCMFLHPSDYID